MAQPNILYETSEKVFHTLTQILCTSFNVEIAFIQINADEDVFYANSNRAETALSIWKRNNLYQLIENTSAPVIIEDILKDERSLDNDFMIDGFELHFFAGIPLISIGNINLGCICLMNNQVRNFSQKDELLLKQFATLVINEYELRKEAGIQFTNYKTQSTKDANDLANSNEGLFQSNEELERFIYITSHDLQEPVRKIRTFINLLKANNHDPEAVQKYIDKILVSSGRLGNLMDDLLNYSRTSNSNKEFASTDLNQVLKTVLQDFELIISQENVLIEYSELPVLPAISIQLYQLFSNLISNAIKFSTSQAVIHIHAADASASEIAAHNLIPGTEYHCISFKDNGIGFEQKNAGLVFELFQRLNGNAEYPGTGIGLSICKRIILNHRGAIAVKTEPGKGSTFTVFFPKVAAAVMPLS